MNNRQKLLRSDRMNIAFLVGWLCCLVFMIWKAGYGFGNYDESLYLAIPYRLVQGDALISEEWNLSQLSGFILYPIMWIYLKLRGCTDGILLSFRYIYVFFQAATAIYLYYRLRDKSKVCALFSALFFMLYTPFNIMALSYNSMGIMFFSTASVTLATEKGRGDLICSGILFACAVLCCPYLISLYFLALLIIAAKAFIHKKKNLIHKALQFTLGSAIIAALFFFFLLSRATFSEIWSAIPLILEDPKHLTEPWWKPFFAYFDDIIHSCLFSQYIFAFCALLFCIILFDKRTNEHKFLYFIAAVILSFLYAASLMYTDKYVNYIMMPLNILGLFSFLLTKEKDGPLFSFVFISAFIYSVLSNASSNQGIYVIASVSSVANIPSWFFIGKCLQEGFSSDSERSNKEWHYWTAKISTILVAAFLFVCLFYMRAMYTFWDQNTNILNAEMTVGPNKGIKTTLQACEVYDLYISETQSLRQESEGGVLYYSGKTWLYLADTKRISAYSSWLAINNEHFEIERLNKYYKENVSKTPNYIFVDKNLDLEPAFVMERLGLYGTVQINEVGYTITVSKAGEKNK